MRLLYVKPELRDLSQGSRIAFVRELRHLSQDKISEHLGLTGECKRRTMTRYEKGDRNPKDDRVKDIARFLKVNFNSLKKYDYKNPEDLIYLFFWLEEYIPNYRLDLSPCSLLTKQSIINVLNNLYDIASKGCNTQSIVLGSTNIAKLTEDEIAIATNKGWTVS